MNLKLAALAGALAFSALTQAQSSQGQAHRPTCQTTIPDTRWDDWFNARVEEFNSNAAGKKQQTTYVIPIIVHLIHGGQALGSYPNITTAQINSEIGVLNADYAGTGFNVSTVPAPFVPLVANCDISFCMAQLDPNGKCLPEPGIDRINYKTRGWSNPALNTDLNSFKAQMDGIIKPNSIWDPTRYLNVWVCDINASVQLLGYATFPAGSGLTGISGVGSSVDDGVVVWARAFGNVGILDGTYNKGRTATHEIGHWLGLRHIWGDNGQCGGSDFCNDTPPQQGGTQVPSGSNFGCPNFPLHANTCTISGQSNPNGDMFMNFMDYCDDPCLKMFTPDQRTRMHTALTNGTYRSTLTQSSATLCGIPAAAPQASLTLSAAEINCGDTLKLTNESSGSPCPSVSWSVNPPVGYTITLTSTVTTPPYMLFNASGVYYISAHANNASGNSMYLDSVSVANCPTDGVKESRVLISKVSLVPNPSNGLVTINRQNKTLQNLSVMVYNSLGELIYELDAKALEKSNDTVDLGAQPPGIYNFVITSSTEKVIKRSVISR